MKEEIEERERRQTQCDKIIAHLEEHGSLTSLEAMNLYGIMRCPSRIHALRERGYQIDTMTITVNSRYGRKCRVAKYVLRKEEK